MTQQTNDPIKQRAIVIGGSMAGLLAARVLANHYREVVVLCVMTGQRGVRLYLAGALV